MQAVHNRPYKKLTPVGAIINRPWYRRINAYSYNSPPNRWMPSSSISTT